MHILVIGAGWYGCHLAKSLLEQGHNVIIIDKSNKIFSGSSYKNQNRLHLGFHYPRCQKTILECQQGYLKFIEIYGKLTDDVQNNIYFIAKYNSLSSIEDIAHIFSHDKLEASSVSSAIIPIQNVEQLCIKVSEKYINPNKSAEYFNCILGQHFIPIDTTNTFTNIDMIRQYFAPQTFDVVLNCTFNHLNPIEFDHYELFCTLLYKIDTPDIFAYTIMDGAFFSIYPYDINNKIYTVTSVKNGPVYSGKDICDYNIDIDSFKNKIEEELLTFMPSWNKNAVFKGYFTSWKTKPCTETDDRSLRYKITDNYIQFYGGKITGIFEADKILNDYLQSVT